MPSPGMGPFPLEFRLLGTCEIRVHGRSLPAPRYRKEWWLLALLVLRHDRDSSRGALAETFWPDSDPDRALFYLRRSLTNLRRALGPESPRLLSPTPRTLRLDMTGAFADVIAFDCLLCRTAAPPSWEALNQAVALYGGDLLPDCAEAWVLPEREERTQAYLSALEALAQAALGRDDFAGAASWLRRLLSADPPRESAAAALMRALAAGGDRAAADQVYHDLRQSLLAQRNRDAAPETQELHRALMAIPDRPPSPPPPSSARPLRRRLPIPLTDLVGRGQETEEVTDRLYHRRLVTLVGGGGVGKTRLAIAAAEAALPRFADGVWFVGLAALTDPDRVPDAVAQALGIAEEAGQTPEERLREALAASSQLLVLDNCEHVLDACAALSSSLLSSCPGLRVLATSRQALGVTGEQLYPVPPLAFPPEEAFGPQTDPDRAEKNVTALLEYEAVRLFVERAVQVSPPFRLTRRNAEAVVGICHRLDGIPLALELAAARVRSLTPAEIRDRLGDRFRLLRVGGGDAAPRHQTLQAAMDWSYALLSEPERSLLRFLSVFAGGWRLDAAEAVWPGGPPGPDDALETLAALVDKSLVAASEGDAATRYGQLETVRQYARERLLEGGEEALAEERQAAWALLLAVSRAPHPPGGDAVARLDRLEEEHDNLRAALDWYERQPPGRNDAHLRLVGALTSFWIGRGHYREGRRRLGAALAHTDGLSAEALSAEVRPLRAKALRGLGTLASSQGDYPVARARFEEALALRQELGDPLEVSYDLSNLGAVTWLQGDLAAAHALHVESLTLARALGDSRGIAESLYNLGILAFDMAEGPDDFAAVRPLLEEAVQRFRDAGDRHNQSYAWNALGNTLIEQGDFPAALAVQSENQALADELNDPLLIGDAHAMLGSILIAQGDFPAAAPALKEALIRRLEMGDKRNAAVALSGAADICAGLGRPAEAARIGGATATLREQIGFPPTPRQQARQAETLAVLRAAVGEAAFDAAWAAGAALPWEAAVRFALAEMDARRGQ